VANVFWQRKTKTIYRVGQKIGTNFRTLLTSSNIDQFSNF